MLLNLLNPLHLVRMMHTCIAASILTRSLLAYHIGALKKNASQEVRQQYLQEAIVSYKKQLAEARERYGI